MPNIKKKFRPKRLKRLRFKKEKLNVSMNSLEDKKKSTKKLFERLQLLLIMKDLSSTKSRKLLKQSKRKLLRLTPKKLLDLKRKLLQKKKSSQLSKNILKLKKLKQLRKFKS